MGEVIALCLGTGLITLVAGAWLFYSGNKRIGTVLYVVTAVAAAAAASGLIMGEMRRTDMYEAARSQGIVIEANPWNNSAIVLYPCVFRARYIPEAGVIVRPGTGIVLFEADAADYCSNTRP